MLKAYNYMYIFVCSRHSIASLEYRYLCVCVPCHGLKQI